MTQSVIHAVHSAYKQSIIPFNRSILLRIEKFIKLVSIKTLYGGPSWVLYLKNNADGVLSLYERTLCQ